MSTFLISFDDTDNLQTLGTGHVLARFLDGLPYETGFITRHQLFVDERVPFTSHNSAMCATVRADVALADLAASAGFDRVCTPEGDILDDDCVISIADGEVKAVFRDSLCTMLADPDGNVYHLLGKQALKRF